MSAWNTFWTDVQRSAQVWSQEPTVPALVLALALGVNLSEYVGAGWLGLLATVATIGLYGAQRLAFLRANEGRPAGLGLLVEANAWYWSRFAALGVLVGLATAAASIPLFIVLSESDGDRGTQVPLTIVLLGLVVWVDVLLTFATTALTFSTDKVGDAWRTGRAMLRDTWSETKFHALAPPLAVIAAGQIASARSLAVGLLISGLGAILSVVARGAHTLAYLRHHPVDRHAVPKSLLSDY